MESTPQTSDLTIIIPALNEAENLAELIPLIRTTLAPLDVTYKIMVVDERANDQTRQVVADNQASLLTPATRGYGQALWAGLCSANSTYIITMDADISHPPSFILELWNSRQAADIIIASRYVPGGKADMPFSRYALSKVLNYFFGWGLGLRVRDMSSGFRLYAKRALMDIQVTATNFDALQEILVKAALQKVQIKEIPFTYHPRKHGSSHARIIKFGFDYLRLFSKLWFLRLTPHKSPK